jgi:alkyl sulfatase BDS1-like metallo-beta-lactamase superfamily hydrolase
MRMANSGLTGTEIAEVIALPAELRGRWYLRDYYGTIRHNSRAIYQRYLGWFDGVPAHLDPHTPVEAGRRYVELAGGADALLRHARAKFEAGDYRWVAEVVNHLVFAEPERVDGRRLLADAYEQLGYQSESGVWRNFYLTGAMELRSNGCAFAGVKANASGPWAVNAMTLEMLSDLLGVRMNGLLLEGFETSISVELTDRNEGAIVGVRSGTLHVSPLGSAESDVTIRATHASFAAFAGGNEGLDMLRASGTFDVTGDLDAFSRFAESLEVFSFGFEIVLP